MGGFDELKDKAAQSGMGEKASDAGIDKVGDMVDEKSGGQHSERVDQAQQAADQKIGE